MKPFNRTHIVVLCAAVLLPAAPAYAYVDPSTGSMLAQLLIGGVMAGLVLFRSGWRRVTDWFRPSRSRDES